MLKNIGLKSLRFWTFSLLLVLAPLSKYPSLGLPAFNFTSFRLGLYQILLLLFVLFCIKPVIFYAKNFWQQNKLASTSLVLLFVTLLLGLFSVYNLSRSILLVASVFLLIFGLLCAWWYTANELNKKGFYKIISLMLWGAIIYGVVAVLQFLVSSTTTETLGILCKNCTSAVFGFPRINGFAAEPQFYANALLPFLFISLAWYYKYKSKLSLLALIFSTLAIGLTFSRGAYFALAIALIVFSILIVVTKRSIKQLALIFVIILATGALSLAMLVGAATYKYQQTPNITYNTVKSTLEHLTLGEINLPNKQAVVVNTNISPGNSDNFVSPGLIESSTNERLGAADLAIKAWQYSNKTFLIGTGAGNLGPFVVNNIDANAPNNLTVYIYYILVVAELGIFGLIAFIGIAFSGLLSVFKLIKSQNGLVFITTASILVAFIVQYLFFGSYINVVYIWIWFGLALGFSGSKLVKNKI